MPRVCSYDVGSPIAAGPGPSGSKLSGSAGAKAGRSSREKTVSAAPKRLWPAIRLLSSPVTVRNPYGNNGLEI